MSLITGKQISKVYLGTNKLFSSGSVVNYYVEGSIDKTQEVDSGVDLLDPSTVYKPTKSGWTFVGWRKDTVASGDVEISAIMGDEPINLYAVFSKAVTLTAVKVSNNTEKLSGYRYYNNGNIVNPKFTVSAGSYSSPWIFKGWATGTSANASIVYSSISNTEFSADATVYFRAEQTITLTYYINGSKKTSTGTKYYTAYNGGTEINPTFTISNPTVSGGTFKGWSASSGSSSISYSSINGTTFSASTTIYSVFEYSRSASKSGSCTGDWNTQNRSSFTLSGSWPNNATCTKVASSYTDGSWHPDAIGYVEFHDSISGYFYLNAPPGGSTVSKTVTFSTGTAKSITCTIIANGEDTPDYNYKATGICTLTVNWKELVVG